MNVSKIVKEIRKKIKELESLRDSGQTEIEEITSDGRVSRISIEHLLLRYHIMLDKAESEWEDEE